MQKHDNEYYLNGIKSRDDKILKEIYNLFLPKVSAFIKNNKGQHDDARDIFNKVIYQFTARLDREQIIIKTKFEAFIFSACKNLWRRELKKKETRRVTNEGAKELYYKEKDMAQAGLEQERWELFNSKLSELSENCLAVLTLFFKKLSSKEIMDKLNYGSEVTVRQRIFKCKTKLIGSIKKDNKYAELKND